MDIFKSQESNVQCYANNFPVVFESAKGCWMTDVDGKRYLDFLAGAGSLNYGHNNPTLKKALIEYIEKDGITHGLDMYTEAKARFLEVFKNHILAPRGLDYKFQFTGPTGTNAVEAAMKLARKVTGRSNIVSFTNGFHGCTYGALAVTGNHHHRGGGGIPVNNSVTRIPYDGYANVDGLTLFETMLNDASSGLTGGDKPAAVLLEVVQGEGGLNAASNEWLQRLQTICKAHDILVIVDDIQAGCGRTGTFFSFEPSGINPDIVTMSKSIGGYGLPMAVVLLKPELDQWAPGEHNGTFRGNNHAFVTAAEAIETYWLDDQFQTHIQARADQLNKVLQDMLAKNSDLFEIIKGRGLMQGIACKNGDIADDITSLCFDNGMIIETAGPEDEVIKFFSPLTVSEAEMEKGLQIFVKSVEQYKKEKLKKAS
ncbi:diaminobutyrate--2-oxoglutarate transaminase [Salinivibrio costicola]|jgi:diaminobutyrate aminotransferase apoenzyme (EC 2.6.1.76)|uniref:diaminobutyrate--2-oxoglutarate transaminase n=1 Tax=Salinivibrio costicola TaxID=51367 RepID=UPI003F705F67